MVGDPCPMHKGFHTILGLPRTLFCPGNGILVSSRKRYAMVTNRVFVKRKKRHWRTDQIHWRGRQAPSPKATPYSPTGLVFRSIVTLAFQTRFSYRTTRNASFSLAETCWSVLRINITIVLGPDKLQILWNSIGN